jgi:protein-S-isoprenylcysteine O-methyltransferase Ste14
MTSRASRLSALARSLPLSSLFIAVVFVYLPWALGIFRWTPSPRPPWEWLGIVPLVLGACIGLYCIFAFAWTGRGTPAPFDPPRDLVVQGIYRYTRNPMYWGGFLILLGQWALFGTHWTALIYTAGFMALAHLLVWFHEEPALRRKFGEAYSDYCRNVPRWMPRLRPWTQPGTESIRADRCR